MLYIKFKQYKEIQSVKYNVSHSQNKQIDHGYKNRCNIRIFDGILKSMDYKEPINRKTTDTEIATVILIAVCQNSRIPRCRIVKGKDCRGTVHIGVPILPKKIYGKRKWFLIKLIAFIWALHLIKFTIYNYQLELINQFVIIP